jgi:hypothetical protein
VPGHEKNTYIGKFLLYLPYVDGNRAAGRSGLRQNAKGKLHQMPLQH